MEKRYQVFVSSTKRNSRRSGGEVMQPFSERSALIGGGLTPATTTVEYGERETDA
jgi:hypothetical protein